MCFSDEDSGWCVFIDFVFGTFVGQHKYTIKYTIGFPISNYSLLMLILLNHCCSYCLQYCLISNGKQTFPPPHVVKSVPSFSHLHFSCSALIDLIVLQVSALKRQFLHTTITYNWDVIDIYLTEAHTETVVRCCWSCYPINGLIKSVFIHLLITIHF